MKTSLDHLPEGKRRELAFVVDVLRENFARECSTRWAADPKNGAIRGLRPAVRAVATL